MSTVEQTTRTVAGWTAIRLVARRELLSRLRSRAFLVGNATTVLLIVVVVVLSRVIGGDDPLRLGLVFADEAPVADIEALAAAQDRELELIELGSEAEAEAAVSDGEVDGALVGNVLITEDEEPELVGLVEPAWRQRALVSALEGSGLNTGEIEGALTSAAAFELRQLEPPDEDEGQAEGLAFVMVILLFLAIQIAGAYIMMGVLEEKTSKVVELILSSISARDLLAGKVLGIGVVGLVQVAVLATTALVAAALNGVETLELITPGVLAVSLGWFVLGYLLYGAVFAGSAALVASQEDAQSAMAPVTVIIMASYFAAIFIGTNPDSTLSRVMAVLPPVAPFAQPSRFALGEGAAWEMVLALVLTVSAVAGVLALAGRIYTRAVWRTDRSMGWREAWRLPS